MTTPTPSKQLSLQDAVALSVQNFQRGEFNAVVYLSDQILAKLPAHAVALQLKGLAAYRLGQTEVALASLRAAVKAAPKDPEICANAVETFRQAGETEEAIQIGEAGLAQGAPTVTLIANLGIAHYDAGDLERAKELHRKALEHAPRHLASLNNLGSIARDEKDPDTAVSYYRRALEVQPEYAETLANLATLYIEIDNLAEAQATLASLFSVDPNHAEGLRCQGRIHLARSELDAAERAFQRAIQQSPDELRNYTGMSQVMVEKNQPELARQMAAKALECDEASDLALHQMGVAVSKLGSSEETAAWYHKALEQTPDFTPSLQGLAQLALEDGESETARMYFEKALEIEPEDTSALVGLSRVSKIKSEDDKVFQALEAVLPEASEMSVQRQVAYRFAMGDIYDGLKRYDEAFAQYAEAARLKRGTISYDADAYDRKVDDIIATFTPAFIDSLRAYANPSLRPMFVLGMPRSGTTMTETILASHSTVSGAGELGDLQHLFGMEGQGGFPANLRIMTPAQISERLTAYLQKLATVDPDSGHVTDKMPANFHMLGVIHALFPNAKVIHTRRSAMDICLSCFTRHFDRSQLQSYDLVEQGRFFLGYQRLMAHWEKVLPEGAFLTVDYESMVADPETNIRAMLVHCDLPWEEACLNFHQTKRRVKTASITQVRQPIYRSSVEKWRRYEAYLGPLMDVLGIEASQ